MKLFRFLMAGLVAVALLGGCGGDQDPEAEGKPPERPRPLEPVSVTLDGLPSPENVGILVADELGYFEEAGMKMTIYSPQAATRPIVYLTEGVIEVAVSHEPEIVLAREKGRPIAAIGSIVSEPTLAMIWLKKSKIDGIADLRGKTIGIQGTPFQRHFLQIALAGAGLSLSDVELEPSWYDLRSDLAGGRVDAIFGGSGNVEGAELEALGLDPVVVPASELGIPPYDELVLIGRRNRVAEDPEFFDRFLASVQRGTAAAIEDPGVAAEAIEEFSFGEAKRKPTEAGLEATLPLLSGTDRLDPQQARDLIAWMHEEGMIERRLPVSALTAP